MMTRGVAPAVPAGGRVETVLGAQRDSGGHRVSWDSSMLIRAAVETLKLPALTMRQYLENVFGGEDQLTDLDISELSQAFEAAERDQKVAAQFRRAIELKASRRHS
jgi:hypothetical protein